MAVIMKEHAFHILLALSRGDHHGAAIEREVWQQTDGALRLWPVTLYRQLDELAAEGLIDELTGAARPDDASERQRIYRITPAGQRALAAEGRRMGELAAVVRERLTGPRGAG